MYPFVSKKILEIYCCHCLVYDVAVGVKNLFRVTTNGTGGPDSKVWRYCLCKIPIYRSENIDNTDNIDIFAKWVHTLCICRNEVWKDYSVPYTWPFEMPKFHDVIDEKQIKICTKKGEFPFWVNTWVLFFFAIGPMSYVVFTSPSLHTIKYLCHQHLAKAKDMI